MNRNHKWEKGPRCARCKLQRRTVERPTTHRLPAGAPRPVVKATEYSRDGATWSEAFVFCRPSGGDAR